jgi:hypothetical protein
MRINIRKRNTGSEVTLLNYIGIFNFYLVFLPDFKEIK